MWDWFIWVKSVIFLVRTKGLTTPPEADPGFLVGGSADPPGAPTCDFAKFSKRLHDIEKILDRRRGLDGSLPDPLMPSLIH